jgi:transposase-like protein
MAQHFLLKAEARRLSIKKIFRMTDDEAFSQFKVFRWKDNGGNPICPKCQNSGKHYFLQTRKIWKCADCESQFSVTSGTVFAYHKLPLQDYLAAMAIYTNGAKGFAALQMSRELDVQYKTAFVLVHKIRESIFKNQNQDPLDGEVEIDGGYFGGTVKQENRLVDRVDRRVAVAMKGQKRCILVMRQRGRKNEGAKRTKTFIIESELKRDISNLTRRNVKEGAGIFADSHRGYDHLKEWFSTYRVNHGERFSSEEGYHTNNAESYFARMRRCVIGQHHHVSNKYLSNYASEIAFREDTRRESNGEIFKLLARNAMKSPVSNDWCGYWQGNKRREEYRDSIPW